MKSLAIISGLTFSLSLLLGVLSGNVLLTLIFRSFLTTGVVLGGYILIREVLKKFVPDLFDETHDGTENSEDESLDPGTVSRKGRKVNIVVDDSDEEEHGSSYGDNEQNLFQDSSGLGEVVEEVQESGIARVNSNVELLDQNDESFLDDEEDVSGNELPDISGLQSTFASSDSGDEQSSSSESDDDYHEETQYSSRSSSKKAGNDQLVADPKILAKAISTALKKGQ